MDKVQALHNFFSSFGVVAYDSNSVPDDAPFPRITYDVSISEFDDPVSISASIWYRSASWQAITQKAEDIMREVVYGGKLLNSDDGMIWLRRGSPFYQRMNDEDDTIRRIYMNFEVEYFNV